MVLVNQISQNYRRWVIYNSDPDLDTKAVRLQENMWPRAVECASEHGVLPIIYEKLRQTGVLIPENSLSTIRDYLLTQTIRIHIHKRFLLHLCKHAKNLTDFMVIKGLALTTQLYSDPYQRPLRDVDILIQRRDFPLWSSFLRGMGFVVDSKSRAKDGKVDFLKIYQEPFEHTLRLELHCELFDYPKRHIWPNWSEWVWGNRVFISIGEEIVPVMGIPVLLPYLCVHQFLTAHGRLYRLLWLVDVLLLIRKHPQIISDKEVFSVITSNPALRVCVYHTLQYVQAMFRIPDVGDAISELRPPRNLYCYVPLMRAEEFLDNKALLPSVKRKIFRDAFDRKWHRKLKCRLRLALYYILKIFNPLYFKEKLR